MKRFLFVESNTTGTGKLAVERLLAAGHHVTFLTRTPAKYPFLASPQRPARGCRGRYQRRRRRRARGSRSPGAAGRRRGPHVLRVLRRHRGAGGGDARPAVPQRRRGAGLPREAAHAPRAAACRPSDAGSSGSSGRRPRRARSRRAVATPASSSRLPTARATACGWSRTPTSSSPITACFMGGRRTCAASA